MWWKRKKAVVYEVNVGEFKAAKDRIKQNPMFVDSLNTIIDYELGILNDIWFGEQDNDTLRAYQGRAFALRELKILISHNSIGSVKEDTDGK